MKRLLEEILNKTNRGRDLIVECYPQFEGVADDKMVKLRDERQGSAHIHLLQDTYILKDFGEDAQGKNGIAVYADIHQMDFKDAVHALAVRYGLDKDSGQAFGPKFEKRNLSMTMKFGEKTFELKSCFSKEELRFLGPNVTEETVTQLSWHSVLRIICCKDDHELVINSTPDYPIFMRDLHDVKTGDVIGHKIYQPRYQTKADGRNFKFSYYPSGLESGTYGSYIHGLYELERTVEKGDKIDRVAIVSGERDALVIKSMGISPIWLNSETKDIPPALVARLFSLTDDVYYIPDVDTTGNREGMKNIKLFPMLKTIWLPESMKAQKGDQKKPCKDLRDWAGLHSGKNDFSKLLNSAKQYQFWEKTEKGSMAINLDNMLYFLNMNGYWRMKNDITDEYEFVHIEGNIVKKITVEEIRNFVIRWSQKEPGIVRNTILKNRKTAMEQLKDLAVIDIDFNNATARSQVFAFRNKQIMVTDEGIHEVDTDSRFYFKERQMVDHHIELLPPMFGINVYEDEKGKKWYCVTPKTDDCKLFNVLIKTSMMYWQQYEMGIKQTEEQEFEEMKSLISKMFAVGHLMHRYRQRSRDWAPLLMDNNTRTDSAVAEGGSGKSFIFTDVLRKMGYDVVIYPAKKRNPMEDDFIFDQVTADTEVFVVDECPDMFEYDKMNSYITDAFTVNQKHKSRFTIPYKRSPKMAFITNFVPHDFGGSAMRRQLPLTYSDYFHYASSNNGYTESRTINDEFGMELMGEDYPWEDWNRDFNFLLQCEQYYLMVVNATKDKPTPDMTNIMKRHSTTQYTAEFDAWADQYFCDKEHLNCEIAVDLLVLDYNQCGNYLKIEKKDMKRQLKAWAVSHGLVFNPIEKCNDKKQRRIKYTWNGRSSEKFYIAGTYEGE